ncbi:unnamed protein product [Plutella xylostella]|uniref:(diamondback moth) hypothetical protein n=1 Tax=Plutella xylostella TaxID=51655 RepID=A0A8S4GEL2_PLUXY|nr:unnamed protein product [Plutella xylostella]
MREGVLSLLALLALCSRAGGTDLKDGFNYYKDYLRGRSDEVLPPAEADRMLYFYRTPLQLYPGILPAVLEQEYRKRTGNAFKNHMLNKDLAEDEAGPGAAQAQARKRSSKTALSLMIGQGRHDNYQKVANLPGGGMIEIPME